MERGQCSARYRTANGSRDSSLGEVLVCVPLDDEEVRLTADATTLSTELLLERDFVSAVGGCRNLVEGLARVDAGRYATAITGRDHVSPLARRLLSG